MNITPEEWLEILCYVDLQLNNNLSDQAEIDLNESQKRFLWQKYCNLHKVVSSYAKKTEHIFVDSSKFLSRVFAHETQEFSDSTSEIGIPLAFELEVEDDSANFQYDGSWFGDLYYFNRYRNVSLSTLRDLGYSEDVMQGASVNLMFYGKPLFTIQSIDDDKITIENDSGEKERDEGQLQLVNAEDDFEEGTLVLDSLSTSVERNYMCRVISVEDESVRVEIMENQGYPDDLVHELSKTKVTMTKTAFKELYSDIQSSLSPSSENSFTVVPMEVFDNAVKFLGRNKLRLSKRKKKNIKDMRAGYDFLDYNLDLSKLKSVRECNDLDEQANIIDDDDITNMPRDLVMMTMVKEGNFFGLEESSPRIYKWFKMSEAEKDSRVILQKFVKLLLSVSTIDTMKKVLMSPTYLENRIRATIEKLRIPQRQFVNLKPDFRMVLHTNKLFEYAYEAAANGGLIGVDRRNRIKDMLRQNISYFDHTVLTASDNFNDYANEESENTSESEGYETPDEQESFIVERDRNCHSKLLESHYIQWQVGEFSYWQKVKDVVNEMLKREIAYRESARRSTSLSADGLLLMTEPIIPDEEVFKARLICLLTSAGRKFLESYFEEGRLPPKAILLNRYIEFRPSLTDLFMLFLLHHYMKDKTSDVSVLIKNITLTMILVFFNSLRLTFIRDIPRFINLDLFFNDTLRLTSYLYQPLLRGITSGDLTFEQRIELFKEKLRRQKDLNAICLVYDENADQKYYFSRAIQCGVYLTKYFQKNRKTSSLFLELLEILFTPSDMVKRKKRISDAEADIQKYAWKISTSRSNKEKYREKMRYHIHTRDSLIMQIVTEYIKESMATNKQSMFKVCDTLTTLIVLSCIASFEYSDIGYLLQTIMVNYLERGTLDLGTYVQMTYMESENIETQWVRCKDKTTIEILSFCKFADIDNNFSTFNLNNWDEATKSSVFLFTPNSKWGKLKGYNSDEHSLFMSYDVESTPVKNTLKRLKALEAYNTVHNPQHMHSVESGKKPITDFQRSSHQATKMTGIAWSIGTLLGTTVVHVGSEWFLTFNNLFSTISKSPFEKFKAIARTPDELQNHMYSLFSAVYIGWYYTNTYEGEYTEKDLMTKEKMKNMFLENIGSIKSNYSSIDVSSKLPRHNYVVSVSEFLGILVEMRNLDTMKKFSKNDNLDITFIKKICTKCLDFLSENVTNRILITNNVTPETIKYLGEMFHDDNFDIKTKRWAKNFKFSRNGVSERTPEPFRIQHLVELVLLAHFATAKGVMTYKSRFSEKLNKLSLALSYRFSKQRHWARNHANIRKLRNISKYHDTREFYVSVPQFSVILDMTRTYNPEWSFDEFGSLMLNFINLLKFNILTGNNDRIVFSVPSDNMGTYAKDLDILRQQVANFLSVVEFFINDGLENFTGVFVDLKPYADSIVSARREICRAEDQFKTDCVQHLRRQQDNFEVAKLSLGQRLYTFKSKVEDFQKALSLLSGASVFEYEYEDFTTDESTLKEDLLTALTNEYISYVFGDLIRPIIKYCIKDNGPLMLQQYDKIRPLLTKLIGILESDDTENTYKNMVLFYADFVEDKDSFLENIEETTNDFQQRFDSDVLLGMTMDIMTSLDDYFEDFVADERLQIVKMQYEQFKKLKKGTIRDLKKSKRRKKRQKKKSSASLSSEMKAVCKQLDKWFKYYIDVETIIFDLQLQNDSIASNLARRIFQDSRIDFTHAEKELDVEEFQGANDTIKEYIDKYMQLDVPETLGIKDDFASASVSIEELRLKDFILNLSFTSLYNDTGIEENYDDTLENIQSMQPSWFTKMKNNIEKLCQGHDQLLRLLSKVKKSSHRIAFKKFCDEVMRTNNYSLIGPISKLVRGNESLIRSFFNVYLEPLVPGAELVVAFYSRNWINQFKQNFEDAIPFEHRHAMEPCIYNLKRLNSSLSNQTFTRRFRDFYNSFIDVLNTGRLVDPLKDEFEPFLLDIALKTGYDLDLAFSVKLNEPWFAEMQASLIRKILEIEESEKETGGSSSDESFQHLMQVIKTGTFEDIVQSLNILQHSRKGPLLDIINTYQPKKVGRKRPLSSDSSSSSGESSESSPDRNPGVGDDIFFSDGDSSEDEPIMTPVSKVVLSTDAGAASVVTSEVIETLNKFDEFKARVNDYYNTTIGRISERLVISLLSDARSLCFLIDPALNTDLEHSDEFYSSVDVLYSLFCNLPLQVDFKEFLTSLESITIPLSLRNLIYIKGDTHVNLYGAFTDLIRQFVYGEYQVDESTTFKNYLFSTNKITKGQLDNLLKYEKDFGISNTFLMRLNEADIMVDTSSETFPEVSVVSKFEVPEMVTENIIQQFSVIPFLKGSLVSKEINLDGNIFSFQQLSSAKTYNDNEKKTYQHIVNARNKCLAAITDQFFKWISKKVVTTDLNKDELEELLKKIVVTVFDIVIDMGEKEHFFIWGTDMRCLICQKSITDEKHIDTLSVDSIPQLRAVEEMVSKSFRIDTDDEEDL